MKTTDYSFIVKSFGKNIIQRDGITEFEKEYDDISHKEMVYRLETIYRDGHKIRRCNPASGRYIKTPDLVFEDKDVAFEIKVSKLDMERSFYQCMMYKTECLKPFLVIHKGLYDCVKDQFDIIKMRLPENTPGVVIIDGNKIYVEYEPNYCKMI